MSYEEEDTCLNHGPYTQDMNFPSVPSDLDLLGTASSPEKEREGGREGGREGERELA
jgi:hypothetical protein